MNRVIYIIILLIVCSCGKLTGYRYNLYIIGDENHTCYEDTLLWGYNLSDMKDYDNEIRNGSYKKYSTISHYEPVNIWSDKCINNRVTLDEMSPKFIYKGPVTFSSQKKANAQNRSTNKKPDKPDSNIHLRSNLSFDVGSGKPGSVNYNMNSGKVGIRVSSTAVVDSDGFHLSF